MLTKAGFFYTKYSNSRNVYVCVCVCLFIYFNTSTWLAKTVLTVHATKCQYKQAQFIFSKFPHTYILYFFTSCYLVKEILIMYVPDTDTPENRQGWKVLTVFTPMRRILNQSNEEASQCEIMFSTMEVTVSTQNLSFCSHCQGISPSRLIPLWMNKFLLADRSERNK